MRRREAGKEEVLNDLPWKDKRGHCQSDEHWNCFRSSIREYQMNIGTVSKARLGNLELFQRQHWGTSERQGGALVGFSEHTDTILNWTELSSYQLRTCVFDQNDIKSICHVIIVGTLSWNIKKSSSSSNRCIFLPSNGSFFVNYTITAALIGTALELLRFSELFMYGLKLMLARSQAEKAAVRKVGSCKNSSLL